MYNFILQIIIMLCLGTIVYLIGRAAPRVSDIEEPFKHQNSFHTRIDKLISRMPLEKLDVFVSVNVEKILRKLKLWMMKWDNLLTEHLNKMKKVEGATMEEKQNLFEEIKEKIKQENSGENK